MEVFIIVIYTVGDHVIMFIFLAHIVFKNLSGGGKDLARVRAWSPYKATILFKDGISGRTAVICSANASTEIPRALRLE